MQQHFKSLQSEKAWLFHRGKWFSIDDPLFEEELPVVRTNGPRHQTRRRSFYGYELTPWTLGPTFLGADYSGLLVYLYVHPQTRKARYLIRIEIPHASEIVYAQDLPDAFDLLRWFAPMVESSILVDLYRRGVNTFSRS